MPDLKLTKSEVDYLKQLFDGLAEHENEFDIFDESEEQKEERIKTAQSIIDKVYSLND